MTIFQNDNTQMKTQEIELDVEVMEEVIAPGIIIEQ